MSEIRARESGGSGGWLISAPIDFLVYAGISTYGAIVVLVLARWVEPLKLFFYFNITFTLAHYAPTWIRAYLDKQELRRNRWRVLLFPPAFAAFAYATFDHPEVLVFIIYIWDRFHALMQNYGFLRMYEAKHKSPISIAGTLDFWLLLASAVLVMSFNMGLMAPFLSHFYVIGLPRGGLATVHTIRLLAGAATAVLGAFYLRALIRQAKNGGVNRPKVMFLLSTILGHVIMNTTTNIYLLSAHEKIYHSVQYICLTFHYNRKRARSLEPKQMFALFRIMAGDWGVVPYLGVIAVWTGLVYAADSYLPTFASSHSSLLTTVVAGVALSHYYFDSFLWRLRRPTVRSNL